MADLSPAAQVLDTCDQVFDQCGTTAQGLAAALRAVADQSENLYDPHEGKVSVVRVEKLLAIAAELEAQS